MCSIFKTTKVNIYRKIITQPWSNFGWMLETLIIIWWSWRVNKSPIITRRSKIIVKTPNENLWQKLSRHGKKSWNTCLESHKSVKLHSVERWNLSSLTTDLKRLSVCHIQVWNPSQNFDSQFEILKKFPQNLWNWKPCRSDSPWFR